MRGIAYATASAQRPTRGEALLVVLVINHVRNGHADAALAAGTGAPASARAVSCRVTPWWRISGRGVLAFCLDAAIDVPHRAIGRAKVGLCGVVHPRRAAAKEAVARCPNAPLVIKPTNFPS